MGLFEQCEQILILPSPCRWANLYRPRTTLDRHNGKYSSRCVCLFLRFSCSSFLPSFPLTSDWENHDLYFPFLHCFRKQFPGVVLEHCSYLWICTYGVTINP